MHSSSQDQAPYHASGSTAGDATFDCPCMAFLVSPYRTFATQSEWYDTQYHTTIAPGVEPNDEGPGGIVLGIVAC